jgi:phosphoenolpyruvate synthase/pyruvate phosphate dikinase
MTPGTPPLAPAGPRSVYFFGNGRADGTREMKRVLGGKGANLAEMTNLGVPVPPGFTIACDVCMRYLGNRSISDDLREEVDANLKRLEETTGKRFGDPRNALLVSVRSGAAVSMPGMMETILNLGLNDLTVVGLAQQSGNARFAYDSYRRFIQMYGDVVLGVSSQQFEHLLKSKRMTAMPSSARRCCAIWSRSTRASFVPRRAPTFRWTRARSSGVRSKRSGAHGRSRRPWTIAV